MSTPRIRYPNLLARIIAKTIKRPAPTSAVKGECWVYMGAHCDKGYGRLTVRVEGKPWGFRVHRVAYQLIRGPIPDGLTLDHLCFCEPCWNPDHLEPVTDVENSHRARARQIAVAAGTVSAMPSVSRNGQENQTAVHAP